jgi:hypothetical protein
MFVRNQLELERLWLTSCHDVSRCWFKLREDGDNFKLYARTRELQVPGNNLITIYSLCVCVLFSCKAHVHRLTWTSIWWYDVYFFGAQQEWIELIYVKSTVSSPWSALYENIRATAFLESQVLIVCVGGKFTTVTRAWLHVCMWLGSCPSQIVDFVQKAKHEKSQICCHKLLI